VDGRAGGAGRPARAATWLGRRETSWLGKILGAILNTVRLHTVARPIAGVEWSAIYTYIYTYT